MNSRIKKSLSGADVRSRLPHLVAFGLFALWLAGWLIADEQSGSPDLTVHEWGTFTAIAGKDGRAVEWTPSTGPTDLPGFVEHLSAANLKGGLRGTIRMETPVLPLTMKSPYVNTAASWNRFSRSRGTSTSTRLGNAKVIGN
jgi:hypothetical protein